MGPRSATRCPPSSHVGLGVREQRSSVHARDAGSRVAAQRVARGARGVAPARGARGASGRAARGEARRLGRAALPHRAAVVRVVVAEADKLHHELLKLLDPERAVPVGIKALEHGARVSVDLELRESVLQLGQRQGTRAVLVEELKGLADVLPAEGRLGRVDQRVAVRLALDVDGLAPLEILWGRAAGAGPEPPEKVADGAQDLQPLPLLEEEVAQGQDAVDERDDGENDHQRHPRGRALVAVAPVNVRVDDELGPLLVHEREDDVGGAKGEREGHVPDRVPVLVHAPVEERDQHEAPVQAGRNLVRRHEGL
mmetsp:Transcript_34830/g.115410  ORF Transcript_34830/g.115410 Transcript_34830/m.115410 type:complete len:312 (+) Transcript_34830:218-1153(+)